MIQTRMHTPHACSWLGELPGHQKACHFIHWGDHLSTETTHDCVLVDMSNKMCPS